MNFDVKFSSSPATFPADFNQVNEVSDGSYEEGYEAGKAEGAAEMDAKLEAKLDKTTEPYKVYGTAASGQTTINWSYGTEGNVIPRRKFNGHLATPLEPLEDSDATSKKYVDDSGKAISEKQTALEGRVSELESLTLSYPEIASTDYEKVVPAEVGKYALLKMIGGASEKVLSKNLINPSTIDVYIDTENGSLKIDKTVDADEFIYFTIDPWADVGAISGYIQLSLPNGRYYLLLEGDGYDAGYGRIDFNVDWGDEPLLTEFKTRIMVYKFEDASDVEILPAPEGTVFEPHILGLLHADVERIESIGKNRLPSDVYDINSWKLEDAAEWKRYYLDLSDGWYCVSLKLKEGYTGGLYFYIQKSVDGGKTYTSSEAGYNIRGYKTAGYLITDRGVDNDAFWFKVDKTAGIIYRFNAYGLTQSKFDFIYDLQIEKVELAQEPSASYPPSTYAPPTEYKPYRGIIDTLVIPEAVKALDGYGREGSCVEWSDGKVSLKVTKDENLEELAKPIVTDITNLFTEGNSIEVEGGGTIKFVNEKEIPVPSIIGYVTRKG